jgi:hypothetical protein
VFDLSARELPLAIREFQERDWIICIIILPAGPDDEACRQENVLFFM